MPRRRPTRRPNRRRPCHLTEGATGVAAQGYRLDIASSATVRGVDGTGTSYGEQTIEQLIKVDPLRDTLP